MCKSVCGLANPPSLCLSPLVRIYVLRIRVSHVGRARACACAPRRSPGTGRREEEEERGNPRDPRCYGTGNGPYSVILPSVTYIMYICMYICIYIQGAARESQGTAHVGRTVTVHCTDCA